VSSKVAAAHSRSKGADSWDVMTGERSYSPPKPEQEALTECLSLAGSQFSPAACKALDAIF
jgi:HD-GYP domain-containing protein (c-di-GMP phosphodiesterase class II)